MAPLVWLVTGTTSGTGSALVQEIAARGDKVIATGRNAEERLADIKSDRIAVLDLDISVGKDAVEKQVLRAKDIWGRLDVLVNNAGMNIARSLEEAE